MTEMTSRTDEMPFAGMGCAESGDSDRATLSEWSAELPRIEASATGRRQKNLFIAGAASSLKVLRRAQRTRFRRDERARIRFERARVRLHHDLATAAAVESAAWRRLLDVPGITVATAAALTGTSPATIRRRLKEADLAD